VPVAPPPAWPLPSGVMSASNLPTPSGNSLAAPDLRGYRPGQSLMAQARALASADDAMLAALAEAGVPAVLARDLGRALDITPRHFFRDLLGTNRSAAEKKAFTDAPLPAAAGRIALALLRLLGRAEALRGGGPGFDVARWLGRWIEQPQDGLQGRRPAEALGSAEGLAAVLELLETEARRPG
jgi:Protein of unknown function (DUF2384).